MFNGIRRSVAATVVAVGMLAGPAGAAPQPKCFVKINAGKTAAGNGRMLARKLAGAAPGDTVHVGGRCTGNFVLTKDVTIVGDITPEDTFLLGGSAGTVVTIPAGIAVTMTGIFVNGGSANVGGGIVNEGNLVLGNGAVVLGNNEGGGVYNLGTFTMTGDSQIAVNFSFNSGAGLYNSGTAVIRGSARIHDNTSVTAPAATLGGGIFNDGTLTLQDDASVSGNLATSGGGVFNDGTFTLAGNASITGNSSTTDGGGISVGANSVVSVDPSWSGSTCDPANSPNDYDASNSGAACP